MSESVEIAEVDTVPFKWRGAIIKDASRYIYDTLYADGKSGSIVPTSQSSPTDISFRLPREVFNPSELYLQGTYTLVTNGAGVNYAMNCPWIRSVTMSDTVGVNIVNCPNYLMQYNQIVMPRNLTMGQWDHKQLGEGTNPHRTLKTGRDAIQPVPPAAGVEAASSDIDYKGVQRIIQAAAGTAIVNNFRWRLADIIPDSFFGLNMNVYFPKELRINLTFAPENSFYWSATNHDDPVTGAAPPNGGAGTITNLRLMFPVEKDIEAINKTKRRWNNISIPIPYLTIQTNGIAQGGGAWGVSHTINRSVGSEIRRILWTAYDSRMAAGPYCADNSNVDEAKDVGGAATKKILTYHESINSDNLTKAPVNCTGTNTGTGIYTDYTMNRRLVGESPLFQSRITYQQNWHSVTDFKMTRGNGEYEPIQKEMQIGGLQLVTGTGAEKPQVWNISCTSPNLTPALTVLTAIVSTRTLDIVGENLNLR